MAGDRAHRFFHQETLKALSGLGNIAIAERLDAVGASVRTLEIVVTASRTNHKDSFLVFRFSFVVSRS
jgi:hypothetical protein